MERRRLIRVDADGLRRLPRKAKRGPDVPARDVLADRPRGLVARRFA